MNRYLLGIVVALAFGCVILFNLWDSTKTELANVKREKIVLEQEIERRNENERKLSKRISELSQLYDKYSDYSNTLVPDELVMRLRESCKACK